MSTPDEGHPAKPAASVLGSEIDPVRLMEAIAASLSRTAIWVFDEESRVAWCSATIASVFGLSDPNAMLGRRPSELLPANWAAEREALIRRCLEEDRPLCLLSILGGKRKMVRFIPVRLLRDDPRARHVLVIFEPADVDRMHRLRKEMPEDALIFSKVHDLGPLDALSPRELEVLALLGEGLRSKDIAEILDRSVSTIEGHRERMGTKLGVKDRAELVALAREAALLVEDADCERVRFYSDDEGAGA